MNDYDILGQIYELDMYSDQLNRWSYKISNRGLNTGYNNHFRDFKLNQLGVGYIEDGTPVKYNQDDDEFGGFFD